MSQNVTLLSQRLIRLWRRLAQGIRKTSSGNNYSLSIVEELQDYYSLSIVEELQDYYSLSIVEELHYCSPSTGSGTINFYVSFKKSDFISFL